VTKTEAASLIMSSPDDELGDTLMQLAVTYWLEQTGSKDEVEFVFEETLKESGND